MRTSDEFKVELALEEAPPILLLPPAMFPAKTDKLVLFKLFAWLPLELRRSGPKALLGAVSSLLLAAALVCMDAIALVSALVVVFGVAAAEDEEDDEEDEVLFKE